MMGSTRMKRKDLEEVNDDFSDFSLSSPATKIRRLDAELLPIMEEEDSELPSACSGPSVPAAVAVDEGENEERAIVVFNPTTPFLQSPRPSSSRFNVFVDPHVMSGFKSQYPWQTTEKWKRSNCVENAGKDKEEDEATQTHQCKAVVPWVPSQHPPSTSTHEFVEAEETMDIDEDRNANGFDNGIGGGLHQWQQQHCMIPQLPHNTSSTPITWSR